MSNDGTDPDLDSLLSDLAQWVHHARLRGFSGEHVVRAIGIGALLAFEESALSAEQVHDLVDHHYGTGIYAAAVSNRPKVKA